ncbi:hypothetical protein [Streptomyces sp. NPDC001933]|uniref:hypothetical protein n=1 Tax=Streptomyces sp. NPDC001933 TaxID=3364626 RepID=UPI00369ADA3E
MGIRETERKAGHKAEQSSSCWRCFERTVIVHLIRRHAPRPAPVFVTGHRPPATGHRPPATGHRPPATGAGSGSGGREGRWKARRSPRPV